MTSANDRHAIAARICGLMGGRDSGIVERTARRLGVGEVALRISIDSLEPHPTLEVVEAVIREYGVDPSWLLTGDYDSASHRRAMEAERDFSHGSFARLLDARASGKPADRGEDPGLKLEA